MKVRLALAAAATIALSVPTVASARSPIPSSRPPVEDEFVWTTLSIRPAEYLFGERVTARLDVVYDPNLVFPESVKIEPSFDPYRIVKSTSAREVFAHSVGLRREYLLDCLTDPCLPTPSGYLTFPPLHVEYRPRTERTPRTIEVEWPDLGVAPRIGREGFGGLRFTADVRDLPPPSYRVDPGLLTAVGYSLAALLASASLLLLARALGLPALVAAALARRRARFSALYRALALLRSASDHRERRRALDRLAAELRQAEPDLAVRATGLAWRRTAPSDPAVKPFSDEVEGLIERGAR